jgi:lipopolysaccharide transport system ATP-binding protein
MRPIVRVKNLSKCYSVQKPRGAASNWRFALANAAQSPLRRLAGRASNGRATVWALRDVSFEVAPGEIIGVIGPNGAGKSTLLKILSRVTKPSVGEADLYGRVGSLLSVGTGFHPNLTGRENIFFHGGLLGMRRAEIKRKFDEIVAFAEMERFLETAAKHYSSGMYVRLAFAIAAHLNPEILLLDEVIAVADSAFQQKCVERIRGMPLKGQTVFFVSHNLGLIQRLCSRALLIESGQIRADAPAASVVSTYDNATAQLEQK